MTAFNKKPGGILAALFAVFIVFISALLYENGIITEEFYLRLISAAESGISVSSDLEVHFIDVGQAECILIVTPEKTVLMDAGDVGYGSTVENHLRTCGIHSIDLFIATHPHADHIGSASYVLSRFPVSEVIMPEIPKEYLPTSSFYEDFLKTLSFKKCSVSYAEIGTEFDLGKNITLEILGPCGITDDNLNNYSVISKLTFGETSFLFTGDAEKESELSVLASGADVSCTVLSVGHHGSSTSTCGDFLSAAAPQYAVISCGANNDYGHPHSKTLEAFEKSGIICYRTDYDGNIIIGSDGKTITVRTEK